jgi:hypothetical protein
VIPVGIVSEYLRSLNSPDHDMVQGTSSVYPRFPWHVVMGTNISLQCQVNKLTALYTREEKRNTPPYNIAGEKLIAMQMENLLLRGKLSEATQIFNEEVFLWMKESLPGQRSFVN